MKNNPLVSICMPTYNVAPYVADCIRSILKQNYTNWELVVVDDGSTDSTLKVLEYYAKQDKRIHVIEAPHRGIAQTRNAAIAASKGDYIAVMDSDDIMYQERLKIALTTLAKSDADVFYSAYYRANERGQIQDGIMPPKKFSYTDTKVEDILEHQLIPHVTIVAKRECFVDNGYNDDDYVNDDMRLVLKWWKANYKFCMSPKPLVLVRYHAASTSATKNKEVKKITQRLKKEYVSQ